MNTFSFLCKRLLRGLVACLLLSVLAPVPAAAANIADYREQLRTVFPDMVRLEEMGEKAPAAVIYGRDSILGYALLTARISPIPGYSGKPIDTLVAFDAGGTVRGVRVVAHQEPILVVGLSQEDIDRFAAQYIGLGVAEDVGVGGQEAPGRRVIDAMSGATITTMVINRTIVDSLHKVAVEQGLLVKGQQGYLFRPAQPLWRILWSQRVPEIVLVLVGLTALLLILLFQDWLARHPTFLIRVRTAYLVFTLAFLGVYGHAQLSVVNVFTFISSLLSGFRWESFLIDPLIFLLWSFVAITVLLWGRGVYCGWLCPFGALQELLFRLGQRVGLREYELPGVIHERLLAVKYLVLLGLFALMLQSMADAERFAEVEPFKTVFTLRFLRDWPFVLYAVLLLVLGLFIRKGFCRYLCPLGASLTYPSRFRVFDWLRRRRECGHPCQVCTRECEVQAIRPTGEIVASECHYCLDCQVTYWNEQRCPPLVDRRQKRERRARIKAAGNIAQTKSRESEDLH